jgi:hypothetical protein
MYLRLLISDIGIFKLLLLSSSLASIHHRHMYNMRRKIQRGNQKSKRNRQHNGQKKKYKRTNNDQQNTTHKTKDRIRRTPIKTEDELGCSRTISTPYSTSATRRATLVRNSVISHKWGKDREVRIARETYPWSFRNGKPSHGGDRNDFNLAYRNPCLLPAIIYQRNPDRSRKLWNIISTERYICRTYNSVFGVIVNTSCHLRPIYYLPFLWQLKHPSIKRNHLLPALFLFLL